MSSWAFPPSTEKLQVDEAWSFVGKKQKNCDPSNDGGDATQGDQWDHVALDPDSRLVLSVQVGKHLGEVAEALLQDVKGRLGRRTPQLITSDEWNAYDDVIQKVFGEVVVPPRTGKPGRKCHDHAVRVSLRRVWR